MPTEPNELTGARTLLARFEAEMHRPEGLVHLSEALLLLADIRADAESEKVRQVALNLSLAYAKKVQAQVEPLLSSEEPVHWETVEHWQKAFGEFERSGFTLPQDVADTRSKLLMKKMDREIALMSPSERKELLERLQAMGDK
jgi:hypothetical protein